MLNLVALMGRLTAEPELKYTQSGTAVCSFTLAVERSYVKQGEQRQTDFIDIVAWRSTAEFVSRYFSKGQLVAVQGSIQTRTYEDKQGNKRKVVEILANTVHFAESKRKEDNPPTSAPSTAPANYTQGNLDSFQQVDDDLPF